MTVSSQLHAWLASDAYTQRPAGIRRPDGQDYVALGGVRFAILEHYDNPRTGYQGTIYQRVDTGEIVVAHRGTEFDRESMQDGLLADGGMVFSRANLQVPEAVALTQRALERASEYAEKNGVQLPAITVTGHSLGGTLAQITGYKFNLRGEAFNPYGAVSLEYGLPRGGERFVNHVMGGDMVSAASHHYGQVRMYAKPGEVAALVANGYGQLNPLPDSPVAASVLTMGVTGSHNMDNFLPVDAKKRSDASVLGNRASEDLADRYSGMFEKYREDVRHLRGAISVHGDLLRRAGEALQDSNDQSQSAPTLNEWLLAPNRLTRTIDPEAGIPTMLRRPEPSQPNAQPQTFSPLILENLQDFRDRNHPQNSRYQSVLREVHRMEEANGIQPGPHSERMAAAWVDQFNRAGARFDLDRFEMRGHDVVALERRDNYFQTPREASLNADQALSRPVEQVSADWAQRAMPHLGQAQVTPQQASVVDARQLPDHDLRRPDRAHHGQFEDLRSQVADLYAKAGIARDESQLERAAAAVALDMQKYGLDRADRLFLTPDRSGMIGPDSGIGALQGQYPLQLHSQTSHEVLQQAPERSFEQWQQMTQQQVAEQQQQQAAQQQGLQRG